MSRRSLSRTVITWPPPQENNSLATTQDQSVPPAPSPDPSVNLVDGQGGYKPPLERFVANGPSVNLVYGVAGLAVLYFLFSRGRESSQE